MFPSATRDPGESPIHSSNPLTVISTVRSNGADSKSNPGAGPDISSSGSNSCKKGRHTGTVSLPANPLGLSFEVVQRLDYLKRIQRDHRRLGDRYEQLPNVTALIQAYRSGQLEWSKERKVTFWSKGRQVLRLTQFDWDRFENVARENDGWKGFWVEGLSGPGPWKMATSHRPGGAALGRHLSFGSVQLEVCIPGLNAKGAEMHFVDDRDVVVPTLYEDDVQLLRSMAGPSRPQPFSMGSELCAYLPDQLTLEEDLEQMNALGYSLDRELIQYLQESPNRASAKDHLTLETIGLHTRHVSSKPHKAPSRFLHRRYAVLGNDRRVGAAPRLGEDTFDLQPEAFLYILPALEGIRKAYSVSETPWQIIETTSSALQVAVCCTERTFAPFCQVCKVIGEA
ncbi:hypothetical protein N7492_004836 [Penicillium capsulatum]|uniref:Uncharacterized protein n=1 Tax=Penicillium capsulatum TaxID=69766 RepID=A0A9W9IAQ1_9EURO|nr:hypothetical protein N7492_004836 [Penicillium capsulatum]KAJ6136055.1 hypothetical protein N7512_001215 [Penicillium capsulatum]